MIRGAGDEYLGVAGGGRYKQWRAEAAEGGVLGQSWIHLQQLPCLLYIPIPRRCHQPLPGV